MVEWPANLQSTICNLKCLRMGEDVKSAGESLRLVA
jgi:hypothetical protein